MQKSKSNVTSLAVNLALAASLLAAQAARADGPDAASDHGFSLGLRAAYAVPFGAAGDGTDLSKLTSGAVPLQLDVGYRLNPHLALGAYLGWGPARLADEARSALVAQGATDVVGHATMRLGLQATYRALPESSFMPWVGLGAGYEWTRYASARLPAGEGGRDAEIGLGGLEAIVQVGGDFRLSPRFTVGPFAALSFGQYRSRLVSLEGSGAEPTGPAASTRDVADKGIHQWLQLGVKGTFEL